MNLAKIVVDGWHAAEATIDSVIAFVKRNTPSQGQAALDAVASDLKQGASDLIGVGDAMLDQVLSSSSDSIVNVFNSGLVSLGFALGGAAGGAAVDGVETRLKPYEVATINSYAAKLKAFIDAAALGAQAQLAGHPPVTAPLSTALPSPTTTGSAPTNTQTAAGT